MISSKDRKEQIKMKHYYVKFLSHSNKFNEDYVASQTTTDLEKFERTHKVVEAFECTITTRPYRVELGKKVR